MTDQSQTSILRRVLPNIYRNNHDAITVMEMGTRASRMSEPFRRRHRVQVPGSDLATLELRGGLAHHVADIEALADLARPRTETQRENTQLGMVDERFNRVRVLEDEVRHNDIRDVSGVHPDHLRWRPAQHAELHEVLILRDEDTLVGSSEVPESEIRGTAESE